MKVVMNKHRLNKYDYKIENGQLIINDDVFQKYKNKEIIGYEKYGKPIHKSNDIVCEYVYEREIKR